MKGNRRVGYHVLAPLAVVGALSAIWAQDAPLGVQLNGSVPLSNQARTEPISKDQIRLKIILDNGESVQATQLEGGMIRMEIEGRGIFGFTPIRRGQSDGVVAVKVFRITKVQKDGQVVGERIKELQTNEAGNQPTALSGLADNEPRIMIQLVGVREYPKITKVSSPPQIGGLGDTGGCCVACNGIKVCACSVDASCGSCCVGVCCD